MEVKTQNGRENTMGISLEKVKLIKIFNGLCLVTLITLLCSKTFFLVPDLFLPLLKTHLTYCYLNLLVHCY